MPTLRVFLYNLIGISAYATAGRRAAVCTRRNWRRRFEVRRNGLPRIVGANRLRDTAADQSAPAQLRFASNSMLRRAFLSSFALAATFLCLALSRPPLWRGAYGGDLRPARVQVWQGRDSICCASAGRPGNRMGLEAIGRNGIRSGTRAAKSSRPSSRRRA